MLLPANNRIWSICPWWHLIVPRFIRRYRTFSYWLWVVVYQNIKNRSIWRPVFWVSVCHNQTCVASPPGSVDFQPFLSWWLFSPKESYRICGLKRCWKFPRDLLLESQMMSLQVEVLTERNWLVTQPRNDDLVSFMQTSAVEQIYTSYSGVRWRKFIA